MIVEYYFMNNRHYSKETWSKTDKVLFVLGLSFIVGLIIYGVMQWDIL